MPYYAHRNKEPACLETSLQIRDFVWAKQDYPIKEFADLYQNDVPFLILVTSGYLGRDEGIHGVASDEMYWFHDVARQPRVVVRDQFSRYFSVPSLYETEVIPFNDQSKAIGKPMSIGKALSTAGAKYVQFHFTEETRGVSVYTETDIYGSIDQGLLEIMDTYDERFLVVHSFLPEGLYPKHTMIPVYIPIDVTVGVGRKDGRTNLFHQNLLEFKEFVNNCGHDYGPLLKEVAEIMVFEGTPIGDYETLTFNYMSALDIHTSRREESRSAKGKRRSNSLPSSPSDYSRLVMLPPMRGPPPKIPQRPGQKSKHTWLNIAAMAKSKLSRASKSVSSDPSHPKRRSFRPPPPTPEDDVFAEENVYDFDFNPYCTVREADTGSGSLVPRAPWYPTSDLSPGKVLQELHETYRTGALPCDRGLIPPDPRPPTPPLPVVAEDAGDEEEEDPGPCPVLFPRAHPCNGAPDVRPARRSGPETPDRGDLESHGGESAHPVARRHSQADTPWKTLADAATAIALRTKNDSRLLRSKSDTDSAKGDHARASKGPPNTAPKPRSTATPQAGAKPGRVNIETIDDIPGDVSRLSVRQVTQCLGLLHLSHVAETFREAQVDGNLLTAFDETILKEEFGLHSVAARKLIQFAQHGWRPQVE